MSPGRVRASWRRGAGFVARVLADHLKRGRAVLVEVVLSGGPQPSDGCILDGQPEPRGMRIRGGLIQLDVLEGVVGCGGVKAVPRVGPRQRG